MIKLSKLDRFLIGFIGSYAFLHFLRYYPSTTFEIILVSIIQLVCAMIFTWIVFLFLEIDIRSYLDGK